MNTRTKIITSFFSISMAFAVQASQARELPDSIKAFNAEQGRQIVEQGLNARTAILRQMDHEAQAQRIAFMEEQAFDILIQGREALASIREDLRSESNIPGLASREATTVRTGSWAALASVDGASAR